MQERLVEIIFGVSTLFVGWGAWLTTQIISLRTKEAAAKERDVTKEKASKDLIRANDMIMENIMSVVIETRDEVKDMRKDTKSMRQESTDQHNNLRKEMKVDLQRVEDLCRDLTTKK